jgi:hypothetical protein
VIRLRSGATILLSSLLVVLGFVLVVETALAGGGIGYLLGALLALVGGVRVYLTVKKA